MACCVFASILSVFPLFAFPFVLFAFFLSSLYSLCPSLFWLSFACPLVLCLSSLFVACSWVSFVWVVVSFSLSVYKQKKGRKGLSLVSSLRVLCVIDLVGVRFPVLVKFVIVSLNLFGDTFIGNCIFVIISPLLEKTFENAIDKFPCVKFVFYALLYVV